MFFEKVTMASFSTLSSIIVLSPLVLNLNVFLIGYRHNLRELDM